MTLKDELNAENGSFLLELRTEFNWNHKSFVNLMTELNNESNKTKNDSELSREITSGFWYVSDFIKNWTEHENFIKKLPTEYYNKAYELINDIVYTYFMSESPYQSENEIENKINALQQWL